MKKIIWFSLIGVLILGSCAPATAIPQPSPTKVSTLTLTPVPPTLTRESPSTPLPLTDTPVPIQIGDVATATASLSEAYFSEIHMMDETEGWAWAAVESKGAFFLLHTSDGGLSWEDVSPSMPFGVPFFLDGKTAWTPVYDPSANSNTGLLQTTDGGQTWKVVNQTMEDIDISPYFYEYAFQDAKNGWWRSGDVGAGTAHMRFYETKDGGATWEPVVIKVTEELATNYYISTDTDDEVAVCNICGTIFYFDLSRILFAPGQGSPAIIFVTKDRGTTWQKVELSGLPENLAQDSSPIQYPTFFNEEEGVLPVIVLDDGTDTAQIFVYETQDGGLTWNLESRPTLITQYSKRGAATQFISRLDGFITTQDELSVTHDGGKTWTMSTLPKEFQSLDEVYIERQLNFIDPMMGWMVLKKRARQTSELLATVFLKTTDGGIHWNEIVPAINP